MIGISLKRNLLIKVLLLLIIIICILSISLKISGASETTNDNTVKKLNNGKEIKSNLSSEREEILYISRNRNAVNNIKYIMDKLGYEVYHLNPWYSPSKRPECFNNGECSSLFTTICRKYNYIIVNEIASDGYGYINSPCNSKIIFELNNRYDINISKNDINQFKGKLSSVINNKNEEQNKNISWVFNTPYEEFYTCKNGIFIPSYHIIHSIGLIDDVPNIDKIERNNNLVVIDKSSKNSSITKFELNKRDIKYDFISLSKRKIKTLSQYKAQVILPYQVSSTEIMENFKYGVVMMIPSQSFLRELTDDENYSFEAKEIIRLEDGLEKYTDWYNEDLKDFFVFFNSWDDIQGILHSVNFDKVREKAMKYAEKYEMEAIKQWKDVLNNDEYSIKHKKPICKSDTGYFYNYY